VLAPRHLSRLSATVGLFTQYGLADFARDQGLDAFALDGPSHDQDNGLNGKRGVSAETAAAFRERLVELGPAFIKLGQVLSARSDLLPEVYINELEKLQDEVGPMPFADVESIVASELGSRISKLFSWFDHEPLGTASLGQAHAARLRDGREVVVKVQRPNLRGPLADDLDFFRELARFITAHTSTGRRVDMLGIIRQLERALADELDYRIEARNAAHFRQALAEFSTLLVPRVIEGYSTERVLTTERIRGIKVNEIPAVTRTELDLRSLAEDLTRAYLKQVATDGVFHADPHLGNVFLVLPSSENPPTPSEIVTYDLEPEVLPAESRLGRAEAAARRDAPIDTRLPSARLALIDFGMTAHLSPAARELCVRMLFGLSENRGDDVADALIEMGETLPEFDRVAYLRQINELVGRAYRSDVDELDAGTMLTQVINVSFQSGLRLPAELTLLSKALVHLGVITRALDSTFEPAPAIRDYMLEIVAHRARSRISLPSMYRVFSESADLLGALPHRLDLITKRLVNNDLEGRLHLPQMTMLLEGLQKVANRIFSGLVLAGLLVASGMLLPHSRVLGTAGFLIAGAIALYMVATILWTDRRPKS
jgi:ubiquinone biosynthesis protein